MMRLSARLTFLAIALSSLDAQQAVEFDVASIRPNKGGGTDMSINGTPGSWRATNISLESLIVNAYEILREQLTGAPAWTVSERYDIEAKFDDPGAKGASNSVQHLLRLQALLASRFHFKAHRETREWQAFVLVAGKKGPKMTTSANDRFSMRAGRGHMEMKGATMDNLARNLALRLGGPVVNETGIEGRFDFALDYEWEGQPAEAHAPSLFTAVQEQLGLKLESKKTPVEMLVVDHIERPTEN